MRTEIRYLLLLLFFFANIIFSPSLFSHAEESPTIAIEKAKFTIEQAHKAGANIVAQEDLAAAKTWLNAAQKELEKFKSGRMWLTSEKARRIKEEEVIYLANLAEVRAMIAENRAKRGELSIKLKTALKELKENQNKLNLLKKDWAETKRAQEFQSKIEAERKALEALKEQLASLEQEKKLILAETLSKVREIELRRQQEIEEINLKEAQKTIELEKELAETKKKLENLTQEKTKEEEEKKSLVEKLALLHEKAAAIERKVEILKAASKISGTSIKFGEKDIIITILAQYLFSPAMEIMNRGKQTLEEVSSLLNKFPDCQVIVRGHADAVGPPSLNQSLSEKRASKVKEYLITYQNVLPSRITAEGWGASQPIASNDTEVGRILNRRVEIIMVVEK